MLGVVRGVIGTSNVGVLKLANVKKINYLLHILGTPPTAPDL